VVLALIFYLVAHMASITLLVATITQTSNNAPSLPVVVKVYIKQPLFLPFPANTSLGRAMTLTSPTRPTRGRSVAATMTALITPGCSTRTALLVRPSATAAFGSARRFGSSEFWEHEKFLAGDVYGVSNRYFTRRLPIDRKAADG
jgi:hypothetical protein